MTDEDLVGLLRSDYAEDFADQAADRIEQLVKERDAMLRVVTDNHDALTRAEAAEAKLDKAIAALDEALYFLDPDEEDIAKGAGLYRIVTTHKELKEN